LFFPLIVAPAELAVPSLGGLEICHLAEPFGLGPDVLFGQQDLLVYLCVEGEFHLAIGRPSPPFLPLAPIFFPAQQVASGYVVAFGNFLGVDAFHDLDAARNTCFTASSFSATVYFR
jgi:hypothetical protein